jgi:predicted nucleic acid-binding protein
VKRLLLDLNVILDVILDREHSDTAAQLWGLLERAKGRGFVPAHGITTIFYLLARAKSPPFARQGIEGILRVFTIAPVDEMVLRRAVALGWNDFEDAVCAAAAESCRCDVIVTRNPKDFAGCTIRVIDAATAVAWLTAA